MRPTVSLLAATGIFATVHQTGAATRATELLNFAKENTTEAVPESASGQIERTRVMNFIGREWTNLIGGDFGQGNGRSIKRREFHHEAAGFFIDMHDCAHVAGGQTVFRQRDFQGHAIEFFDHVRKG